MPKSSNQKLKLLYLAKIFLENTDSAHALTLKELSAEKAIVTGEMIDAAAYT